MAMEITRGKMEKAKKVVLYGPEGIGKSTFASRFPDALFCDTEGSTVNMDVARTPRPSSWTMLLDIVKYLGQNTATCRTFVLDTADWAERMCVKHVCDKHNQEGVEGFGYGKGYVYVYEEFGKLLNLLTDLIEQGVNVVITAHAQLRKFEQPDEMGSYDRYELKLTRKTGAEISAMLKEWADMVLFANYKTYVVNVDGQGAAKGKNKAQGGKRVMYTTHTPSWDAKNRSGLPEELDLDFKHIAHLFAEDHRKAPATPTAPPAVAIETKPPEPAQDAPSITPATATPPAPNPPANDGIPKALRDLMEQDHVTEQEIMFAVAAKGYYPGDTPISKYEPAFVAGVLIAAWPQVRGMVETNREKAPF